MPPALQPFSIKLLYGSAIVIETFDSMFYLTNSRVMIPNREELAHPLTRTFMRANGVARLPFYLIIFLLRDYHIRSTEVGRAVGYGFAAYQIASTAFWFGSSHVGEYTMKPLWYVCGMHGIWSIWSIYGLLAAE